MVNMQNELNFLKAKVQQLESDNKVKAGEKCD